MLESSDAAAEQQCSKHWRRLQSTAQRRLNLSPNPPKSILQPGRIHLENAEHCSKPTRQRVPLLEAKLLAAYCSCTHGAPLDFEGPLIPAPGIKLLVPRSGFWLTPVECLTCWQTLQGQQMEMSRHESA